ncbi:hypothetical protein [Muricoccus aerilatus]|uniref:hypothetical protein n=1 Tax=Muricoccus aerilatus TaxID=452982 RepID=UPI0005C21B37|nr:hypothetical protein [Roseomonas aerilata]
MSATILPFARVAATHRSVTQAERAQAAGWAAHQAARLGGSWWVEAHVGEDDEVWLGVVTPSSLGRLPEDRTLTWMIAHRAEGFALIAMPSGRTVGVFHSLGRLLTTIERREETPRGVAYAP